MSPQLLWTIAGLILTVLTLGGVSISSYQSMDSAKSKLIASEVGNIATAAKLWMVNSSTAGTFDGINANAMTRYIPDLTVDGAGTPATSTFVSKADPTVTFLVEKATGSAADDSYKISVAGVGMTVSNKALLTTNLTGKSCTVANADAATAATAVTYTCKG